MSDAPRQTYGVRHETRRAVIRDMFDPDEAWVVYVDPMTTKHNDGTSSTRMGFPVLVMCGWVSDAPEIAAKIAALLQEAQI